MERALVEQRKIRLRRGRLPAAGALGEVPLGYAVRESDPVGLTRGRGLLAGIIAGAQEHRSTGAQEHRSTGAPNLCLGVGHGSASPKWSSGALTALLP